MKPHSVTHGPLVSALPDFYGTDSQRMYEAPLPLGIERGSLVGPSLTTWIAYLKGACLASFSTVRKFLRDVVGVTLSRRELARIIGKVSQALERPYQELLDDLPGP